MSRIGQNPEIVTYVEGDGETARQHIAIVLGSRYLEHHAGEDDQPLLTLAYARQPVPDECVRCQQPERAHGKPTTLAHPPCAQFVTPPPKAVVSFNENLRVVEDVAHLSHEFSSEQLQALAEKGFTNYPGGKIPGGRWIEYTARELAVKGGLITPTPEAKPAPAAEGGKPPEGGSGTIN